MRMPVVRQAILILLVMLAVCGGCGDQTITTIGSGETGGEAVGSAPGENACGGEEALTLDAEPVEPGDNCGQCDDGLVVCDGEDEVRCVGAVEANECGGCEPLHAFVDDPCGPCDDGRWECDGDGGLECVDASETNDCGGCGELDEQPGGVCGDDGSRVYVCTGPEEIRCVDDADNPCGGNQPLDDLPGTSCGVCDGGIVACEGPDQTTCVDADRGVNDCGGCETLPGMVGHRCGGCDGEFVCDDEDKDDLTCQGGRTNDCGGCESLREIPGESCGSGQIWACETAESVHCSATAQNSCGGNTILPGSAGESCGVCDDGEYVCSAPDRVTCRGDSERNLCGGCEPLEADPLDPCGDCGGDGEYVCASIDSLECIGSGENGCGGCAPLAAQPGSPCSNGGTWVCDGPDAVECVIGGWEVVDEDVADSLLRNISGTAHDDIWAVGDEGFVAHYDGEEWELLETPAEENIWGVHVASEDDVWFVGIDWEGGGIIWHYDGEEFHPMAPPLNPESGVFLREIAKGPGGELWTVGRTGENDAREADGIIYEYDEGEWKEVITPEDAFPALHAIDVAGDGAWAAGRGLAEYRDGEWTAIDIEDSSEVVPGTPSVEGQGTHSMWSAAEDDVWLVGNNGHIFHYDGDRWGSVPSPTDKHLRGVWGRSGDHVWAVGYDGAILHYAGEGWVEAESSVDRDLNGVWGATERDENWAVIGDSDHPDGSGMLRYRD